MSHPVATASCVAWYRGDSLVDGGGGVASSWDDKSGNAYHLTPNNGPTIVTSPLNGRLAAQFAGASSQYFSRTSFTLAQPHSIIVVGIVNDDANRPFIRDVGGIGPLWRITTGGVQRLTTLGGGAFNGAAVLTGAWHIFESYWDGASTECRFDNTNDASGDVGTGLFSVDLHVGHTDILNTFMDGQFAEVVIWDKVLDSGERAAFLAYYTAYYVVASSDGGALANYIMQRRRRRH